jgi:predicted aconitase with swiveling domain
MESEGMKIIIHGRKISKGTGEGPALVSGSAISFFGGVDPKSGLVIEKGHELEGMNVKGKVLVFSHGKGSTAGSWVLYAMKDYGTAPSAIINVETEPIVAVGAIVSGIPLVDKPDRNLFASINTDDWVKVDADEGIIEINRDNTI